MFGMWEIDLYQSICTDDSMSVETQYSSSFEMFTGSLFFDQHIVSSSPYMYYYNDEFADRQVWANV